MTFCIRLIITGLLFGFFPLQVQAAEHSIRLGPEDLQSVLQLAKPESSHILLNQTTATIEPAPALKTAGLETLQFEINLGRIANWAQAQFHQLKSEPLKLIFHPQGLRIHVPFNDNSRAASSLLGSLGFQNAAIILDINFKPHSADPQLEVNSAIFAGSIQGTGIFAPAWIRRQVRRLMLNEISKNLESALQSPKVIQTLKTSLEIWGMSRIGTREAQYVPGSIVVNENGILYEVASSHE
jgi:hypothetical protein